MISLDRRSATLAGLSALLLPGSGRAQEVKGGQLRVGILADISNFDPQSFLVLNFPVIKNLYDSLIEYTPDGKPIPSLATEWQIAPDAASVTLALRRDVKFQSGSPFDAKAVAATLEKAADPRRGKNVYATMSIVKGWTALDDFTFRIDFKGPAPEQQITDLLQFVSVIDPAGIDTVETKPAGTGAYVLAERAVGQRLHFTANPNYWRSEEPVSKELVITIFSEDSAASAALESGAIDIVYGGTARSAVRLKAAGYQMLSGPGKLVQVFRINATRGPFRNEKFRQAFNYLMDRANILRLGYANVGQVVALPWAPVSPAYDASYNEQYAFNIDKAKALLKESGLSEAEMNGWKLMVNTANQPEVVIAQLVQSTIARVGIKIELDLRPSADFTEAMLGGKFDAIFGAIGNVQKFPSRLATNSIYRTENNPVLGTPHPFPAYVEAIKRVDTTIAPPEAVKAAYDNLNKVLVDSAFGIPTNTIDSGLIVAAKNVGGVTLDIDNMLVARTIGFTR
ncbi:MAG TPA: ABC transporter substrate-binding protein [Acetobacteraceae bacterium]|nr:ABC transporter substrate-binding protein [Acetobacteraceae bacterium]